MRLDEKAWPLLPVFDKIAKAGVERAEMRRTFNCGLGLVAVVAAGDAEAVRAAFESAGERAFIVGEIVAGAGEPRVEFA
jgi:phosphoribosylformylglycinamidine cyclo-ligase